MLKIRVIPCLDVKDGRVVKGVRFVDLRDAGDPVEAAMAYDAARGKVVLFAGDSNFEDTWEWNGSTWTKVIPASVNPPNRSHFAMAYDAARAKVVLYGGFSGGELGDTWEWDGAAWTQMAAASAPGPTAVPRAPRPGRRPASGRVRTGGALTPRPFDLVPQPAQQPAVAAAQVEDGRTGRQSGLECLGDLRRDRQRFVDR